MNCFLELMNDRKKYFKTACHANNPLCLIKKNKNKEERDHNLCKVGKEFILHFIMNKKMFWYGKFFETSKSIAVVQS